MKTTAFLDSAIRWLIILLPFSIAIAPAPANVFMGLLIASFLVKKAIKRERLFVKTSINYPLLLLFIITCLSVINSVNLRDTLRGGVFRLLQYSFVFMIAASEVKNRKHLAKIFIAAACGLALASIDAIWQVTSGRDFVRGYPSSIVMGLVRATASFNDPNILGVYLSALAPLIFGIALYAHKRPVKIAAAFFSLAALAGIALTYSRPTLLATYAALFFLGIARKNKPLILALVAMIIIAPFIAPQSIKDWAKQVEYNPVRFFCNDDRIAVYRNSLRMIKAHPLLGVGANAFMKSYGKYKEYPEYRNVVTLDAMQAHNNFLHMAGEIGLTGLSIFLWLLYGLFKGCSDIYRRLKDEQLRVALVSLTASLIAFLVNGLTESSLYSSRVAVLFWFLAGLALALNNFTDAAKQQNN
ncbi:MAG: O-antigen ligase family protein [Candidatus Omnitrophota bacterium]